MTFLSHLACSKTGNQFPADRLQNLSRAGAPLLARYDLEQARSRLDREEVASSLVRSMWRYGPLMPVSQPENIVTLGEGMTPLLRAPRLGRKLGAERLLMKDESYNPTGTFKARGMSAAVSMAKELGAARLAAPSAGNAAGALAAYCAAAGLEAHLFMPNDVPEANYIECRAFGARVTLVDGLISDCGKIAAERAQAEGWFEVSTLKEPYRIEGKKTIGYEIAEQLGWRLPDALLYPTGGGVGLIGMWKAFDEMEQLGWIDAKRPKMIAVQAEGCAPIVKAFQENQEASQPWAKAWTAASGLRVPKALGDFLVLTAVRESSGTCVAVSDQEMLEAGQWTAQLEGLFPAPEGAACVAALGKLLRNGFLDPNEEILILNTGTGLKYLEAWSTRVPSPPKPLERLGGLVLPR